MDLSTYLNTMRDPSGVPFYPVVFQFLMVLTFAMHITMINLVFGGTCLAIWERTRGTPYGIRLSKALGRTITVGLSVAIVLGVAPLLFVQVIYDPFWYTANTMSAFWALSFLVAVSVAFYSAYGFYLGGKKGESEGGDAFWAGIAVAALLAAAFIIHMLSMEQLQPQNWKTWLSHPWLGIDTSGGAFHGVSLGRLLHFLISSFAVTGIFLMLYGWYFQVRSDYERDYLEYVAGKGVTLALVATAGAAGAGWWWAGTIPQELHYFKSPFFIIAVLSALVLVLYLAKAIQDPIKNAVPCALAAFITIFFMCYAREALRMETASAVGYNIFDYKLNLDWGSTLLFLGTFVMGLVVLYFPTVAAFQSGRAERGKIVQISPAVSRVAIGLMVFWFVAVAGLGVAVSLKNGTLF